MVVGVDVAVDIAVVAVVVILVAVAPLSGSGGWAGDDFGDV